MFKVEIKTMPKENILDPQGVAVLKKLHRMDYSEVKDVRIGKSIELFFEDEESYDEKRVDSMIDELLVNDVVEDCEITICYGDE